MYMYKVLLARSVETFLFKLWKTYLYAPIKLCFSLTFARLAGHQRSRRDSELSRESILPLIYENNHPKLTRR